MGRRAGPSRDPGAQALLSNLDRLIAKGEAERLSGQVVSGMDCGVIIKLVPTSIQVFPEELFSSKAQPRCHSCRLNFPHRDAVA